MQTAQDIIKSFVQGAKLKDPGIVQTVQFLAAQANMKITDMHSRALACHCECMGMEIENGFALASDQKLIHSYKKFKIVMAKWGMTDENNQPII